MTQYLLVNFGGPRNLNEIPSFLSALLCDRDVIRTPFPTPIHNWLFRRIARKRSCKIREDYEEIGGRSPIYFDTEELARQLSDQLKSPVLTFHRYLPATHKESIQKIEQADELLVLPLFPQFCYATTGSIARYLAQHLSSPTKLSWIKSYSAHPSFIRATQNRISDFLKEHELKEEETILLFSAHGVPQKFIDEGDLYEKECIFSYNAVMKGFPKALGKLSYQSKFGKGEWLKPYTNEVCDQILAWSDGRKNLLFIPISFTSDHIETLFEVEKLYKPIIESKGLKAYRCPALNLESYWIEALIEILNETNLSTTEMLIRR